MTYFNITDTIMTTYIRSKKQLSKIMAVFQTEFHKISVALEGNPISPKISSQGRKQIKIITKRDLQLLKWK